MRKATKRGLKPSDNDRNVSVRLSYSVTVNYRSAVGALAHFAARRIVIVRALFLRYGIMSHHRVNVSRADKEAETGLAKGLELLTALIIGLREDRDSEACRLEHAAYYGRAKGWVVNVAVP